MNFQEWLLTEKYMNDESAFCEFCHAPLTGAGIIINPRHIYDVGQMRTCKCKKSKVWTNSVRNEVRLLAFLNGETDRYTNGFCNDKFCGYCFDHLYPLKNGVDAPWPAANRMDRYGCTKGHNENILINGFQEGKELDTPPILAWYRDRKPELEKAAMAVGSNI